MPIFVRQEGAVKQYSVAELTDELKRRPLHFPGVVPVNLESLIGQLLTRYDFGNRRFISFDALQQQIVADALEEATDVRVEQGQEMTSLNGLNREQWKRAPFQSNFKAIAIAKIGEMEFLALQAKSGGGLEKEAELIHSIECMGVRTVPVYGRTQGCMFQRCITGSFMDFYKQDLTCRPAKCKLSMLELSIYSAFLGEKMPSGEAAVMGMARFEAKLVALIKGAKIPASCISTAITDFSNILNLITVGLRVEDDEGKIEHQSIYISDLQGVLEAGTGKFFVIDPLAVKPLSEAKGGESSFIRTSIKNLEAVIAFLSTLLFPSQSKK